MKRPFSLSLIRLSIFKLIFFLVSFLLAFAKAFSQDLNKCDCVDHYDSIANMDVAVFVQQMPAFSGGDSGMAGFLRKNLFYPKNQDSIQSLISLEFVVDTNGVIQGGRIAGKAKNDLPPLDKEGLRILSLMPRWIPGKCHGNKVPVLVNFQCRIELQL
jgi:protein TonB